MHRQFTRTETHVAGKVWSPHEQPLVRHGNDDDGDAEEAHEHRRGRGGRIHVRVATLLARPLRSPSQLLALFVVQLLVRGGVGLRGGSLVQLVIVLHHLHVVAELHVGHTVGTHGRVSPPEQVAGVATVQLPARVHRERLSACLGSCCKITRC